MKSVDPRSRKSAQRGLDHLYRWIMDRWVGKVAVVTGASCGIGLATAIGLVKEGMIVVGIARRKAMMEEKVTAAIAGAKGKFFGQECDITIEESVIETFQTIKKNFGAVHVLVNNAGQAVCGGFLETKSSDWRTIVDVNVMGLLYCTREALKIMKETQVEGLIININSIEGHRVHIYANLNFNIYPATKHAVTAITEALQKEGHGDKIRFTSISPGFVKTEITNNFPEIMRRQPALLVEDIVNAILYVISTPPRLQVHELIIRPVSEKTS